jgi:hypothetical protein
MQFKVGPASGYTREQTAQETRAVLHATATEYKLEEKNGPFWVKGSFCLFAEPTNSEVRSIRALWFGARFVDDSVVIDGGMWNPGCVRERNRTFERVQMALGSRLTNTFGNRVTGIEKYTDRIPVEWVKKQP